MRTGGRWGREAEGEHGDADGAGGRGHVEEGMRKEEGRELGWGRGRLGDDAGEGMGKDERVDLGWWNFAPCGIGDVVRKKES